MKYHFQTAEELIKLTKRHNVPISEIAKLYESQRSGNAISTIRNKMKLTRDFMYKAVKTGIKSNKKSIMGISGGDAQKIYESLKNLKRMMGNKVTIRAMAYALAVSEQNARMGRIVAFPTAGGAGVVPGVLFSSAEHFKAGKRKLLRGLFCASAVGLIIAEGSTISAAKGGCQAEVGSAVAMAAAGLTEMRGGTPEQCFDASAIAFKSYLGLACDPLAGLVEVPCIKRNAIGCMNAIGASDMAMAGVQSYVPFDEVVRAARDIGRTMPRTIKETALGGLAITPTGNRVKKKLGLRITREL
ncbi:MAG: L-serine ammonia-lyase, iron-sulfur-dependent, subunit alpha [Nitrospirae bacterium]|nr:L-serine ammonia-lyase, iron-sulfur-dependent, subunit alpha [Nitrospirota bacterium]